MSGGGINLSTGEQISGFKFSNLKSVDTTITGNININRAGSDTTNGIYWNFGGSKIYAYDQFTISSDDHVDILLNQSLTGGHFNVYSGTKNTWGDILCSKIVAYGGISIGGTISSRVGNYAYLNSAGINYFYTTMYRADYSLWVDGRIGTTAEINCWSDKRIKTNITNITHDSLKTVRKLEPVKFNYIDFLKNTKNKDAIGFIAQDIFDVLPDAVSKTTDIIPNIYDIGILTRPNIITLKTKKTSEFSFDSSPSKNIKIKVYINNKEEFVYLDEIIDDTTIRLTEPITTEITDNSENHIFVYGQEVNDLLTIEKNAIFTMAVGAIKELDAELQETKTTVKKLQEQVECLMAKLK